MQDDAPLRNRSFDRGAYHQTAALAAATVQPGGAWPEKRAGKRVPCLAIPLSRRRRGSFPREYEGNNLFAAGLPGGDTPGMRRAIHSERECAWGGRLVERALLLAKLADGAIDGAGLRAALAGSRETIE
jgi:hypothetical protein